MPKSASKEAGRLFQVESGFQKLARSPGGMPRDQAIENAKAALVEMRSKMDSWIDGELCALQAAHKTNSSTSIDAAGVKSVYSAACRLRDLGTTAGFDLITSIAANVCNFLEAIEAGAEYRHDLVDCHVSALLLARQERYRGVRASDIPELTDGLRALVKKGLRPNSGSDSGGHKLNSQ